MVISRPPGNNPSLLSHWLHQRCLNCSECAETPYVLYMQLQHQNYSLEMVLLSIFFLRIRSTEGSSADCSLFILSLHALALHLAVKILLQIFLYEDLKHVNIQHICRLYFPPECHGGPHFVTQPILLSENIS